MSLLSKKSLFLVGVVLLAHAMYMAFSMRQQLQAWHHGSTGRDTLTHQGTNVSAPAMMIPLTVEVLLGFCLTLFGFILRVPLSEARLVDYTKGSRYDEQIQTGIPFMTFNHRGTARNRVAATSQSDSPRTAEMRKKD